MEGQAKPTRRSKVTGLQDAARLARGALEERPELCLGGLFKQSRPVALVRALLAAGARVDAADHQGLSPLHVAARR